MESRGWRSMGGWRGKDERGSFKSVWSRRNRAKIHKDTYYFKIKGQKKEWELRMQGMGGGRFAPPVSLPPPLLARVSDL